MKQDLDDIYSDLYVISDMFDTVLIQITQCREESRHFGFDFDQTTAMNEMFEQIIDVTKAAKTISTARINRVSFELSKAEEVKDDSPKEWLDRSIVKDEW